MAVDQQINSTPELDRADFDAGLARNSQHQGVEHDLCSYPIAVIEGARHRIAATHFLGNAGGVDLQQEAALDGENTAAVDDGGTRVVAAKFKAAIKACLVAAWRRVNHQAQGAGNAQGLQYWQVKHRRDAQLQGDPGVDLRHDHAEVALKIDRP